MKRTDPEIRSLLAAEYVIGTLTGGARRRFEQQMLQSKPLQEEVQRWELHLATTLDDGVVSAVPPPASAWDEIARRIGMESRASSVTKGQPTNPIKPQRRHRRRRIGLALAASIVIALVVMVLPNRVDQPVVDDAVVQAPDAESLQPAARLALDGAGHSAEWMVGTYDGEAYVRAVSFVPPAGEHDYELWWVAGGDAAPVSLCILPKTGMRPMQVPAEAAGLDVGALAISLEAPGGSTDGTPGEVLAAFPLTAAR